MLSDAKLVTLQMPLQFAQWHYTMYILSLRRPTDNSDERQFDTEFGGIKINTKTEIPWFGLKTERKTKTFQMRSHDQDSRVLEARLRSSDE